MSRRSIVAIVVAVIVMGGVAGVAAGGLLSSSPSTPPSSSASNGVALSSPSASASPSPDLGSPSSSPSASPSPTPVPILGPLDGLPITAAQAKLHPIAVMIDDLSPARPQSGFSDASVVWQAPAEGGIPRYMMIFQEGLPKDVGPVRSTRYYFIAWAAEWRAAYVHAGGSPQALDTLKTKGNGQLVYNVDQFRWGHYFRRITTRFAPHNLYTTGKQLRELAAKVKATKAPGPAVWKFGPDAPLAARPSGGRIEVDYLANKIIYKYDRASNTYVRYVSGGVKEVDASTKKTVAPKNVVIMRMHLRPAHERPADVQAPPRGQGHRQRDGVGLDQREDDQGHVAQEVTDRADALLRLAGHQITLTAGQTFVQVMKTTDKVSIKDGKVPPAPRPSASPASPSPSPSALGWLRDMPA